MEMGEKTQQAECIHLGNKTQRPLPNTRSARQDDVKRPRISIKNGNGRNNARRDAQLPPYCLLLLLSVFAHSCSSSHGSRGPRLLRCTHDEDSPSVEVHEDEDDDDQEEWERLVDPPRFSGVTYMGSVQVHLHHGARPVRCAAHIELAF
jgi:hypothetical protein